jgi:hypothetical protein
LAAVEAVRAAAASFEIAEVVAGAEGDPALKTPNYLRKNTSRREAVQNGERVVIFGVGGGKELLPDDAAQLRHRALIGWLRWNYKGTLAEVDDQPKIRDALSDMTVTAQLA